MYYRLLKRRLYIYVAVTIVCTIMVGLNTVAFYERKILSEYREKLLIVAGKRQHMMREIQRIQTNIKKASMAIPVTEDPEAIILNRADTIRMIPGVKVRLENFMKRQGQIQLPVTLTYSSDEFVNIIKLLYRLKFKTYPLFYYKDINIEANRERTLLNCTIKGFIFTPVLKIKQTERG